MSSEAAQQAVVQFSGSLVGLRDAITSSVGSFEQLSAAVKFLTDNEAKANAERDEFQVKYLEVVAASEAKATAAREAADAYEERIRALTTEQTRTSDSSTSLNAQLEAQSARFKAEQRALEEKLNEARVSVNSLSASDAQARAERDGYEAKHKASMR